MEKKMLRFLIPAVLLFFIPLLIASDLEKEKRWAEQIEEGLLDGEIVMLNTGGSEFLSIFTPSEKNKETAVILLHGMGVHPDWPQVINPLRVSLPEKGWSTLSLQLPILPNEAEPKEYQPLLKEVPDRIDAGIQFLQKNGVKKIFIVAHSLGTEMASYYLTQKTPSSLIKGYIGIGMSAGNSRYLSEIDLPVLDLYGENDLEGILASANARTKAAVKNKNFSQQKVSDADHFFNDQENQLVKVVTDWLNNYPGKSS